MGRRTSGRPEEGIRRRRRRQRARRRLAVRLGVTALLGGLLAAGIATTRGDGDRGELVSVGTPAPRSPDLTTAVPAPAVPVTAAPPTAPPAPPRWSEPAGVGRPYGSVPGLLTFRGNPTRTYYGAGPVPRAPEVLWRYPDRPMCGSSTDPSGTKQWCGTGWTGQPAVWERPDGTWMAFGAYDKAVHVLDPAAGRARLSPFPTGDIIKGSVTVDPDGFPLLYSGSRDNHYRVLALDRGDAPVELWRLSADDVSPRQWNDDWDGAGLILRDHLLIGGENSQFHVVRLNRGYDAEGRVTVAPQLVFNTPGWDEELIRALGDRNTSIETSVAVHGDTVYFANSGGLVQGWDLSGLEAGRAPTRTFRWWTGDDTDATIVVDEQGMLYVGSEYERRTARSREVGQLVKLDPRRPDDPLVWSVSDTELGVGDVAGIWSTAALHRDLVLATTNAGRLLGVDRATGGIRWELRLPGPVWSSPVVVDDVWVQGDCEGVLHAFDVSDTSVAPPELWSVEIGGCIESTPAVWGGRIYVGTRAGFMVAVGDTTGPSSSAGAGLASR